MTSLSFTRYAIKSIAITLVTTLANSAFCQNMTASTPQNIVQLAASGTVEVQQDLLSITMNTTREGAVASYLEQALNY